MNTHDTADHSNEGDSVGGDERRLTEAEVKVALVPASQLVRNEKAKRLEALRTRKAIARLQRPNADNTDKIHNPRRGAPKLLKVKGKV